MGLLLNSIEVIHVSSLAINNTTVYFPVYGCRFRYLINFYEKISVIATEH